MELIDALSQNMSLTDQGFIDLGNTLITKTNSQLWSYDRVVKDVRFGKAIANKIYNAILVAGDTPAATLFVTSGLDLSLTDVQGGLTALPTIDSTLADSCTLLKTLGVWQITNWVVWGMTVPTLDDVSVARSTFLARIWWTNLLNETINPMMSTSSTTITQIKNAIANG